MICLSRFEFNCARFVAAVILFSGLGGLMCASGLPNIIVIMADDLGYSDLGCYGGEIETPHIDQLAIEGVRFTGFRNAARCAPSRASLLTGRYQHALGLGHMATDDGRPGYRGQISSSAPTIAEILRTLGYGTGVFGKWHVTVLQYSSDKKQLFPLDRGFDSFYGTWWGAKSYFSPEFMMEDGRHLDGVSYPEDYYLKDDLSERALDFVESQIEQKRPFFLYMPHYAPHAPIEAPAIRVEKCRERYQAGFEKLQLERFSRQERLGVLPGESSFKSSMPAWDLLSEEEKQKWVEMMATYAAMIEIMDDSVGELVSTLKKHGHYDNTLILFLSDNGATSERKWKRGSIKRTFSALSNTPFRGEKGHTYEGGIASPLILSWPDRYRQYAGAVRHDYCHIIDILPTCLEAAEIEFPKVFLKNVPAAPDGDSLLGVAKGDPIGPRHFFCEHEGRSAVRSGGGSWFHLQRIALGGFTKHRLTFPSEWICRNDTQRTLLHYPGFGSPGQKKTRFCR